MADMYGAVRSNTVAVRDHQAFQDLIESVSWGDETPEVWPEPDEPASPHAPVRVTFGASQQYPTAVPQPLTVYACGESEQPVYHRDWLHDSDAAEEDPDFDLDEWVSRVRQLLMPGEILHVVGGGNEKVRYVGFTELIVAADQPKYLAEAHYSDDDNEILMKRLAGVA